MIASKNTVIVNAWETEDDHQTVLALAGHSDHDEIRRDREVRAKQLTKTLAINPSSVGFEIGSGNGIVANLLAGRCARVDCNDISQSFLALAEKECAGRSNVQFFQISDYLEHLPANSYDFGYSLNVFIHLNPFDIYHYLSEVYRVLKPGGQFYFDACTLGPKTRDKFLEHAALYRNDPAGVRGFLAFNHPGLIRRIVDETKLKLVRGGRSSRNGWMTIVVRKP